MSCRVASNKTISVISMALAMFKIGSCTPSNMEETCKRFLSYNIDTYNYVYGDSSELVVGTYDPDEDVFPVANFDPLMAYGCVKFYAYQACDASDWDDESNEIRILCEQLKEKLEELFGFGEETYVPWGYGDE